MSFSGAIDVVVPTVGRASLDTLLRTLDAGAPGCRVFGRLVVVDDRRDPTASLSIPQLEQLTVEVVGGRGRGPAAARNDGWRRCAAPWIVFLDDDVVPCRGWWAALRDDLAAAHRDVAAVQGVIHVPLPPDRRPTDWERNVAGLERARWITADMAVRRRALAGVGGFDERFPRAYREDADLALRLQDAGWRLTVGRRRSDHPVRPADWSVSIHAQRGNADDALMRRLHGPAWRPRSGATAGALADHVVTAAAALAVVGAAAGRRPRPAQLAAALWILRTGRFWWRRVEPGPRSPAELMRLAATSVVVPVVAPGWAIVGRLRARRLAPRGPLDRWALRRPRLVLFDRDGTLVDDVPYNGDPVAVRVVPGAARALDRLRAEGIDVGMITNQSGVARGLIDAAQVAAVNRRVEDLLGPFATVEVCRHGAGEDCSCRKPAPGMVLAAADVVGVDPRDCAVVGDIGADVAAGLAAGARAVLVPTVATRRDEVFAAPEVAGDLGEAVDALVGRYVVARVRDWEDAGTPDGAGELEAIS